ncbi:MAG TPA: hypothetical protein VGA67_05520, partial [Candidatus Dojkabacteria bacterium]
MEYKYGEPNEYGEFPYLYCGQYKEEELNDILLERLPDHYPMEIVCPVEEQVLSDISSLGIDSHLEGISAEVDEIRDRKIDSVVICKAHALGFDKANMICLIRRLEEYNPEDFDHSGCEYGSTDYDWDGDIEEGYKEHPLYDFHYAS